MLFAALIFGFILSFAVGANDSGKKDWILGIYGWVVVGGETIKLYRNITTTF